MGTNKKLTRMIRKYRKLRGENITHVANAIGIDRTYLSKIESGHANLPFEILHNLISHYQISHEEAIHLLNLAGDERAVLITDQNFKIEAKGGDNMQDNNGQSPSAQKGLNINIPANIQILYSDSVYVTSSPYGIVFDFAQNMASSNQQTVVARIGMSKDHAKALLKVLKGKVEGTMSDPKQKMSS